MSTITRREFINGMALGSACLLPLDRRAFADASFSYPPRLTGMRGSHPGSFEIAHALRDGTTFDHAAAPLDERFDLIVVGAGISGLSAAAFYREHHPYSRVLILEPNDDFGGHARRNEFIVDGHRLLGYGGTQSIEAPHQRYAGVSGRLLQRLGVDFEELRSRYDLQQYASDDMTRGVFFKKETFGVDAMVRQPFGRWDDWTDAGASAQEVREFVSQFPLSTHSKELLIEMYTSDRDVLAGQTLEERRKTLGAISAAEFLQQYWNVNEEILNFLKSRCYELWALGLDSVPAARTLNLPGFAAQRAAFDSHEEEEPYTYHFPDGNATIARLLVRHLVPSIATMNPGHDVTLAQFDYSHLDRASQPCRLRLNSTVVDVRNVGHGVEVAYVENGRLRRAAAKHSVLACYHSMIPYIVSELKTEQRDALARNVKVPLVYVTLAARNWLPWKRLKMAAIDNPAGTFSAMLDFPVSMPGYHFSANPSSPICIHLEYEPTVTKLNLDDRAQYRQARRRLYAMTFAEFEHEMRDELGRMLGPAGFDFDRDIAAITINRWPHGYSHTTNTLFETEAESAHFMTLARRKVGHITIANADSAYDATTNSAIDEADRAVNELFA